MDSKSKYSATKEELNAAFVKAGLGEIASFEPLGEGMFNAVYKVETKSGVYAIKIAPKDQSTVMTYEKNMLRTEVFWYEKMTQNCSVPVPKIYFSDFSKEIIKSEYFIMECVDGTQLNNLNRTEEEKKTTLNTLCRQIADIHGIKNDSYGYVQNGLHKKWSDAVRSMFENCEKDLNARGKSSRRIKKLIDYCDKFREVLDKAPCTLVNYDIWEMNIIAKRLESGDMKMTWIDPERGFYGDPLWDFICLDIMKMTLKEKSEVIEKYNEFADEKVKVTDESEIRFAFALGYMGAIQETEKFYRFGIFMQGWWFDVFSSSMYYKNAFKMLEKYAK